MSATERFIEEMGLILQESGAPRIAGRILGLLVAEGKSLSLQQISERLGVSRASVSTNARMLARRGVLKLTSHSGDRQDFYELTSLPYLDMIGELTRQFRRHAEVLQSYAEPMMLENRDAGQRVNELHEFFRKSADLFDDWAETLREQQATDKIST